MTQAEKNVAIQQKAMDNQFKQDMRRKSVDLALSIPNNRQSYSSVNFGQQQQIPKEKGVDDILKDAEKIYKYLIQKQ